MADAFTICREIRRVTGGFIVELRWPYGGNPIGYGEVICTTWDEVEALLRRAGTVAGEEKPGVPREPRISADASTYKASGYNDKEPR